MCFVTAFHDPQPAERAGRARHTILTSALASAQPRQAQVQAVVAIVPWGSVPKRRLRAPPPPPPALLLVRGRGPFSRSLRFVSHLLALSCPQPPACSGSWQPRAHCCRVCLLLDLGFPSLCLDLWVDAGLLTAGARGSPSFLFPPPSNREGLCLIGNTQLYVNILLLLGVGCTHSPPPHPGLF